MKNLLYDSDDPYAELSQVGRYFLGGIIDHIGAIAAFTLPDCHSYVGANIRYATWGRFSRNHALRVALHPPRYPKYKRIEFSLADPLTNPYLAIGALLLAGLDGILRKIEPGDPYNGDPVKLTAKEAQERRFEKVPSSLREALEKLETDSKFLEVAFPKSLIETYIEIKREEIRARQKSV